MNVVLYDRMIKQKMSKELAWDELIQRKRQNLALSNENAKWRKYAREHGVNHATP